MKKGGRGRSDSSYGTEEALAVGGKRPLFEEEERRAVHLESNRDKLSVS